MSLCVLELNYQMLQSFFRPDFELTELIYLCLKVKNNQLILLSLLFQNIDLLFH